MGNFLYLCVLALCFRICFCKRSNQKMLMVVPEKASNTIEDMMAPIMMGILLKLLAMIPMVLIKIGFFAITSLLGSIISLVLSVGGMLKNYFFPDKKTMTPDSMSMMMPPNMDMMLNKPYNMQDDMMMMTSPEIMHKNPTGMMVDPSFKTKSQSFVDINNFLSQNQDDDLKTSASSNRIYRFRNGHHEGQHSRSVND